LAPIPPLEFPAHSYRPEDCVLVKTWEESKLEPIWEGPYQVLWLRQLSQQQKEVGPIIPEPKILLILAKNDGWPLHTWTLWNCL
jgi:hypothetical protein